MIQSQFSRRLLPESYDDAQQLMLNGEIKFMNCVNCERHLTHADAANTAMGWRETQISGFCEPCFDALFEETGGDEGEGL